MKYPVFICDDEQEQINLITQLVKTAEFVLSENTKIEFSITSATTSEEVKDYLSTNNFSGGIYFLDVELGSDQESQAGFDLAELIKQKDNKAQIIFVTSHADLSIITYQRELGPVDYVVKTSDIVEFQKYVIRAIKKATQSINQFEYKKEMSFTYSLGAMVKRVDLDDVIYIITAPPHKLLLTMTTGEGRFLGSINEHAKNNPKLLKISQSCLVNPKNISSIDFRTRKVTFINGDTTYFSQSNTKKMRELQAELLSPKNA